MLVASRIEEVAAVAKSQMSCLPKWPWISLEEMFKLTNQNVVVRMITVVHYLCEASPRCLQRGFQIITKVAAWNKRKTAVCFGK